MSPTLHHERLPAPGYPRRWMRGATVAAVASALLLIVGPPAAHAVDGPARQALAVVEADATSVGRPVAPQPEAAPPVPAPPVPAGEAPTAADRAVPARAGDFVWLLPLGAGLAVLGVGWVLNRRNRDDDSD